MQAHSTEQFLLNFLIAFAGLIGIFTGRYLAKLIMSDSRVAAIMPLNYFLGWLVTGSIFIAVAALLLGALHLGTNVFTVFTIATVFTICAYVLIGVKKG